MTPPTAPSGARVAPTVATVLHAATRRLSEAGIATARQDAETLLARELGTTRLGLHTAARASVADDVLAAFDGLVARRAQHEPFQYLVGEAEFCGLRLAVGPGVFIPRPETEALAERALALGPTPAATVLDLCAGSGALACALAARRPGWRIWAVEQARAAATVARGNVRRLGLEGRVQVLEGDLWAPLAGHVPPGAVDLVVANPPYLAAPLVPALPAEVREWEPGGALEGGPDGLVVIRRLLREAAAWLRPGGTLLVEIGEDHRPAVTALAGAEPRYGEARVHRDFRGQDRILEVWRR
jgi:release factor glutamine methyltransferase